MVHHPVHVVLCQVIEAVSLGEYPSDQLVIHFDGSFLLWATCITIKEVCPAETESLEGIFPKFYLFRIGELAAIVREYHGEEAVKVFFAESFVQCVKNVNHRL